MSARLGYRFAAIPEWVLYHDALEPVDVRVFGVLSRIAIIHPAVDPSLEEVGAKIGVAKSTVHRAISRLAGVGAVIADHRTDEFGRDVRTVYHLAGDTPLRSTGDTLPAVPPATSGVPPAKPQLTSTNRVKPQVGRGSTSGTPTVLLEVEIPPGGATDVSPPGDTPLRSTGDTLPAVRQELITLYVDEARRNGYDPTGRIKGHVASQLKRLLEKDHKPVPVLRMALIAVAKEGKPIGDLDYVVADAERSLNGHGKEVAHGPVR